MTTLLPPLALELNSPQVKAAYDLAQANPNDPKAQMALALAFWDAGERRQALEALNAAANLAPTDRVFLQTSALDFAAREAWGLASVLYVRLLRSYPPNEAAPAETVDAMHEAVYKSAGEVDFAQLMQIEMVERVDPSMGLILRGRAALLADHLQDARGNLDQARLLNPKLREAAMLEAEILVHEKRVEEARAALMAIGADQGNPEWIRIMAEGLMKTLP